MSNMMQNLDYDQEQEKPLEMSADRETEYEPTDDSEVSEIPEVGDGDENDEEGESGEQQKQHPNQIQGDRAAGFMPRQEFDIESLASSSTSSASPPPQAMNLNEKKQAFMAAQLAEPNESPHPGTHLGAYQFNQQEAIAMDKMRDQHHQPKQPTGADFGQVTRRSAAGHGRTGSQKASGQQQQQHDYASSQTGNIDYDEHVKHVDLFGVKIVALTITGKERLCLAQISNTLLKNFSYNEIHNRRVALGITCVQCTPIQLEMLRRAGAMPSSSRRCGMITMREAERLCRSFLAEEQPPELPENFYFTVGHRVNYGCKGRFIPSRYISSRAKCIECFHCGEFYSPNKFIFHSHKQPNATDCNPPDSPNINSWRKHINLDWTQEHSQEIKYAWEDVKSLFNGGTRRRTSAPLAPNNITAGHKTVSEHETLGSRVAISPPAQQRKGSQRLPHNQIDQPVDVDIEHRSSTIVARGAANHSGTQQVTLSQSERRKLPMSSWPRVCNQSQRDPHDGTSIAPQADQHHDHSPPGVKRFAPLAGQDLLHHGHHHHQQRQQQLMMDQQQQQPNQAQKKVGPPSQWLQQQAGSHLRSPSCNSGQSGSIIYPQRNQSPSLITGNQSSKHSRATKQSAGMTQASNSILSNTITAQQRIPLVPNFSPQQQEITVPPGFLYGQLYTQLMQSQLNNQPLQQQQQQQQQYQRSPQISTLEAQLALRHHIWTSLLANIRYNPNTFEVATNSQAPTELSAPLTPINALNNNNNHHHHQMSSVMSSTLAAAAAAAASNLPSSHQQLGIVSDLSNQSPPSTGSSTNFSSLHSLLPQMRLYGSPASQVGLSSGMTTLFKGNSNNSCK